MAADPVVKGGAECRMRDRQGEQKAKTIMNGCPYDSRNRCDQHGGNVRQMNQRKAEPGDEYRPDGLIFWKQSQESSKQIELEKSLLYQRPKSVNAKDGQEPPIEDAFID